MRLAVRSLVLCSLCFVGLGWSATAEALTNLSPGEAGGGPFGGPLVVTASPMEGEQRQATREAALANPTAIAEREASQTKYEGLNPEQAAQLASEAFPEAIDHPSGALPPLPSGQQVVGYPADNAAQLDLGGGKHGVIESTEPIAVETSPGRHEPLDLGLGEAGGAFQPKRSGVGLRIPKQLASGVQLPGSGVSLTPVDEHGTALAGAEGAIDGAAVIYSNTQTDSDTVVKPLPTGFAADTLLRSVNSPSRLSFRVGLPAGASLVSAKDGSGAAEVVDEGTTIAVVPAPGAHDAEGAPVPVSMSVAGDMLVLSVAQHAGVYREPIVVDPTVAETGGPSKEILLAEPEGFYTTGTWGFYNAENPSNFRGSRYELGVEDVIGESVTAGQRAFFFYPTQGESKIYGITAETTFEETFHALKKFENVLGIENVHSGTTEASQSWIEKYGWTNTTVCALSGCATGSVTSSNDKNEVFFMQAARESGPMTAGVSKMRAASVDIVQEAPPAVSFDTNEATFTYPFNHPNALYGGKWVKTKWPEEAEVGVNATDPGMGVSEVHFSSPSAPKWIHTEQMRELGCTGVQCNECFQASCGTHPLTAQPSTGEALPDGEDVVEATVKDPVGLTASTKATVKIDNTPPYNLTISGLPPYNEIGYGNYKVKLGATDGTSVASSGVALMTLTIDGKEVGTPHGSCSPGPCTATGEWTINGGEYAAGKHVIVITATDAAGNKASSETSLTFHAAERQSVGPGSIEPASGAFTLSSTDVSLAAPDSAGLTVQRSFQSRRLAVAVEGPFGRQWQGLSFGGDQSLSILPTGSVVLTGSGGQQSLFTKEGAKFAAPTGDTNLTLTEESASKFKLTDQAGNTTTFTVPSGGSGALLTPSSREAAGASGATKYTFQTVGGVTEPIEALAPPPAGVTCTTLVKGCRALTFNYASTTTATGEAPAEWGDYTGRITRVYQTAYNPSAKEMQTVAVAQYAYDKQGRLRAEWDPRISPALKTRYGYDAEGHVTAVSPPGQQPWLMHYGTIEGDASAGRLLSVIRPSASTALGEGIVPSNTELPKLSTTSPVEGTELTVSNGSWSHGPLAYNYQWEVCNGSGAECEVIPGATNQGYTPRYSDEEHTLAALVTAVNAGGASSTVATTASAVIPVKKFPEENSLSFGAAGSGSGQFNDPQYVAVVKHRGKEEVLVTDRYNNRVEAFDTSGRYLREFGSAGAGESQMKEPTGIAGSSEGKEELWVVDSGNKRIKFYQGSGEIFERNGSTHAAGKLGGITVEGASEYLANAGASQIERFENSVYKASYGSEGTESGKYKQPNAVSAKGGVYVADTGNNRVQEEILGFHFGEFGEAGSGPGQLKGPKGILAVSGLGAWVVDTGNDRVQLFCIEKANPACPAGEGKYQTQFGEPPAPAKSKFFETKYEECLAAEKSPQECERLYPGVPNAGPGQMNLPVGIAADAAGELFVVDAGDNRVEKWGPGKKPADSPLPPATPPNPGTSSVWTIEYKVPVSGAGAPQQLTAAEVAKWGQSDDPVEATAIFPPDEPMGWPAKDYKRATVSYRDSKDRSVNVASPSGAVSTTEFNSSNDVVRTLSADNRARALKEGAGSAEASRLLDTQSTFNGEGTELQSTLGPQHTVKLANGTTVEARDHQQYSYDEGAPSEGGPYGLATKVTDGAQYAGKEEDVRTTTTSYSGQENLGWKLRKPTSVTTDPSGLKLTHTILYDATTGNVIETRTPASPGTGSAHDTQTIYYTAAASSSYPACGEHPEWAGLTCQTQPAAQPGTAGLPNLPVTTVTYNTWDEPEKATETVGSTTRTKTSTYDAAGRMKTSAVSSTVGAALPSVNYEYNAEIGALEKQSTTTEGKTKTITSVYNALGQLTSYTDADENTATYSYDVDGRPEKVNDGKGAQTYTYDPTTGFTTKLVDSAAGAFTGAYDVEGNLLTEGYPNGMNANYAYNQIGKPTGLEYVKTTNCTEKCTWFSDSVVPSIHGQWLSQASTLSSQSYTYDAAGRLAQVQSTPAGKGCTTRVYAYEEDTNRLSLTTREPGAKGECTSTGGTVEKHSYDSADRLTDAGAAYSTFGNITALPAADAGGSELTSAYYVDNQLQSETQNGQTIGYNLDPAGRTRETVSTGTKVSDIVSHYAEPSSSPAWTVGTSGEWTRNISGIGGFAAVQSNGETPVLQLTNLHGDVIATAYLSETATGLASTADTSEFGIPTTSLPPKYSWLGADEIPTELPSGVMDLGARSYVPQLGRFLQPDPRAGGSANAYSYTFGDPVNASDSSGEYSVGGPSEALINGTKQMATEAAAEQAAINAAARAEAERKAEEAAAALAAAAGPQYEEEEEWGEEEGEEYADYHQNRHAEREASFGPGVGVAVVDNGEGRVEDAVVRSSPESDEKGGGKEVSPSERCGTESSSGIAAGEAHREYVHARQCRKMPRGWYKDHVYGSVRGGRITIRHGGNTVTGAIKVTGGALGMAAGGFSFAACAVYGGEVDLALHCFLGPGAAFSAGLVLVGSGISELFE